MVLWVGLLTCLLACGAGCQDQEKTAVVRSPGAGGTGGDAGSQGLGRGGTLVATGGSSMPPSDAAVDVADVVSGPDASDTVTTVPEVAPEMPVNPLGSYAGKPWNGTVLPIPGIIEAEFFDVGGEGVAFHDTDVVNHGNGMQDVSMNTPQAMFRRAEAVDVSFMRANVDKNPMGMPEPINQLYVGWIERQEWLKYTVQVAETGNYMISSHAAVNIDAATISFSFEDGVTTGSLSLPRSGSFATWEHVDNMAIVKLTAGLHLLHIKFETAGYNLNYISFIRKP